MSPIASGMEPRGHDDTAAFSAQVSTRPRTAQRLAAAAVLLVVLWVVAIAVGLFGAGPAAEVWRADASNGGIPSTPTVARFSPDELASAALPGLVPLTAIPNGSLTQLRPLAEIERRRTAGRRHTLARRPRSNGRGSRTGTRRRPALGARRPRIRRTHGGSPGSAAPARPVVTPKPVKPVRTPPATGRPVTPPQQQPGDPGRPKSPGPPESPGRPVGPKEAGKGLSGTHRRGS